MATDLGKVGMVMKGDYNSASTYEALDVVSYNNGLYVAKQNVPAGTVPTNTTYWQKAIGLNAESQTLHNVIISKNNNLVNIVISLVSRSDVSAITIPVQFRPSSDVRCPALFITSNTNYYMGLVSITAAGSIGMVYASSYGGGEAVPSNTDKVVANATYYVN